MRDGDVWGQHAPTGKLYSPHCKASDIRRHTSDVEVVEVVEEEEEEEVGAENTQSVHGVNLSEGNPCLTCLFSLFFPRMEHPYKMLLESA
jgi:hypothetical protein